MAAPGRGIGRLPNPDALPRRAEHPPSHRSGQGGEGAERPAPERCRLPGALSRLTEGAGGKLAHQMAAIVF